MRSHGSAPTAGGEPPAIELGHRNTTDVCGSGRSVASIRKVTPCCTPCRSGRRCHRPVRDDRRTHAQIADERRHRDVDDSSPNRRPFGHPPGTRPSEARLNPAHQRVAAEDAEAREPRIVRIGWMVRAATGKPRRPGRQVHLDQIRDEDPRDVRSLRRRCPTSGSNTSALMTQASSGVRAYFRNSSDRLRARRLYRSLSSIATRPSLNSGLPCRATWTPVSERIASLRPCRGSLLDGGSSWRRRRRPAGRHRSRRVGCSSAIVWTLNPPCESACQVHAASAGRRSPGCPHRSRRLAGRRTRYSRRRASAMDCWLPIEFRFRRHAVPGRVVRRRRSGCTSAWRSPDCSVARCPRRALDRPVR